MKDFLLDESGDIVVKGDINHVIDSNELAQSVRVILSTRLSEFILEEELGVSHDNLLGKKPDFEYLKQDISEAILEQEERISSVEDVVIEKLEGRKLKVNIFLISGDNETEIEVELDA